MFSLDLDLRSHTISTTSSSIGPEGESDDNPIRLQGDSAEEFRALLWALYALPHELMVALTPHANPLQLFHLSRITHKYQFRSIETWALNALTACYTRSLSSSFDSQNPSLAQITELAALCEQKELLDACITRWKRLLGEGKDVSLAIDVSEKLGLRGLMGLAYHSMLLKGQEVWEQDDMLSREQRIRLLSGHYKLGKLWERLPNEPPVLNHSTWCTGKLSFLLPHSSCILTMLGGATIRCTQSWTLLWKSILDIGHQVPLQIQYADVPGKLILAESVIKALVEGGIPSHGMLDGMSVWCKENAVSVTKERVRSVKEGLADFFEDVK